MQQIPSSEAKRISVTQEILRILWNPKIHYRFHKYPPPVPAPVPNQIDLAHAPPSPSWRSILILSSHLRLSLPSGLFPSGSQNPIYTSPIPIHATCRAHLILLDLITGTILGEQYRSFSSSLWSLPHSPVTSSLLAMPVIPKFPSTNQHKLDLNPHTYIHIYIYAHNHRSLCYSIYAQ